jgi:hypothetical protein
MLDHDQTDADADDLTRYLPRLQDMLADQPTQQDDGSKRRKISGSPAPWNPIAAGILFDIHAGARDLERSLSMLARSHQFQRGGSDEVTVSCLRRIAMLVRQLDSLQSGNSLPKEAAKQLHRWARECRRVLDEQRRGEEKPTTAPGGLRCPTKMHDGQFCDTALVLPPGAANMRAPAVYCPRCRDEDGQHPSWPWDVWTHVVNESA